MKMEDIEESEGLKFPDLFRKIYDNGAMTWMAESDSWIDEHREELENAHGTFMWGVEVDWEPLLFEEIESEKDYMTEIDGAEAYKLKEEYDIVPFAHSEGGDIYAFAYEDKEFKEIILYRSDENDILGYGSDFEKFLTWQMCFAVIVEEQEIDEDIIAHAQYLNDEHKAMFENKDMSLIERTMTEIEEEMDESEENLLNTFYELVD